jgi:hypothetical protein
MIETRFSGNSSPQLLGAVLSGSSAKSTNLEDGGDAWVLLLPVPPL